MAKAKPNVYYCIAGDHMSDGKCGCFELKQAEKLKRKPKRH